MGFGDHLNVAQADTESGAPYRLAFRDAELAPEDPFEVFLRNADAVIGHRNAQVIAGREAPHEYVGSSRRILDRIVHQIDDRVQKTQFIGSDQLLRRLVLQLDFAGRFQHQFVLHHHVVEQLPDAELFGMYVDSRFLDRQQLFLILGKPSRITTTSKPSMS